MVKQNNEAQTQPEVQNVTAAELEPTAQVAGMDEATANVTSISQSKGKRVNRFEQVLAPITQAAQSKVELLKTIHSKAEEANKLISSGEASEDKLTELGQDIALTLFNGRTQGILANEEITSVLGDSFGFKLKGDGKVRVTSADPKASKTPFGWGEAIRKRVVRAVAAHTFVKGGDAGAFFSGLTAKDVAPVLNELASGDRSIWTVYDKLGQLKNERTGTRPKLAFDANKIAQIVKTLGENMPVTVETISNTRGLFDAYLSLYRMIAAVGENLPEDVANAA